MSVTDRTQRQSGAALADRLRPYAGLAGLLAAVLVIGLGIERFVGDPESVLASYRLFSS
jgi:hypothetical protein